MSYVAVQAVRVLGARFWRIHCPSCGHTGPRTRSNADAATAAQRHQCKTTSSKPTPRLSVAQRAQEM